MRVWFAITEFNEFVISMFEGEIFEKGKLTINPDGIKIIGLGYYDFEDEDDFKMNWRIIAERLKKEVLK